MIRALVLTQTNADFQSARASAQLLSALGSAASRGEFAITHACIGPGQPYRNAPDALFRLRRESEQFDFIHAWGSRALIVGALLGRRLLYTPSPTPGRGAARLARAVANYRDLTILCPSATLQRVYVRAGVALDRVVVIRPGVDFARIKARRDPALREALGIRQDDRVFLLCGESTRAAGHREAVWTTSILHVLSKRYRLLAWGRGPDVAGIAHLANSLRQPDLLILAERALGRPVEYEELLAASDAVLVTPAGICATLPIAIAMASGLPIVATATDIASELLEDRHSALMTKPAAPRQLARRLLDLEEEPSLQWSIADVARTEAYEFYAQSKFVEAHRVVYRQSAAGEPVVPPALSAGISARFHGRG